MPTGTRRLGALLLGAMLLAACGSDGAARPAPGVTAPAGSEVAFRDEGATTSSAHDGGTAIEAGSLAAGLRITAYQGAQRTGGYAIRIERITRAGTELRVHARFSAPATDAMVTMALTSPAHTVSVDETADVVVLYDTDGVERARARPR